MAPSSRYSNNLGQVIEYIPGKKQRLLSDCRFIFT
jgi:hypothetical protein